MVSYQSENLSPISCLADDRVICCLTAQYFREHLTEKSMIVSEENP